MESTSETTKMTVFPVDATDWEGLGMNWETWNISQFPSPPVPIRDGDWDWGSGGGMGLGMSVTTDALMRRWAADDRHEGEIGDRPCNTTGAEDGARPTRNLTSW